MILEVGEIPKPIDAITCVRNRVLETIDAGVPWNRLEKKIRWRAKPGACPWWLIRQTIGGRANTAIFSAAVEGLIAEGRVIEVWLAPRGHQSPSHVLLLPGRSDALRRPPVQARGDDGVIAAEPWGPALLAMVRQGVAKVPTRHGQGRRNRA